MTIREVPHHGKMVWQVSYVINGKQEKKRFPTRLAADAHAEQVTKQQQQNGNSLLALSPEVQRQVLAALDICNRGGFTLIDCAQHYQSQGIGQLRKTLVKDAIQGKLDEKVRENHRANGHKDCRSKLSLFKATFGERWMHEVTQQQIIDWLEGKTNGQPDPSLARKWCAVTSNDYLRVIKALFNYGIRSEMIKKSPAQTIKAKKEDRKEPCILSPEEAERLMIASLSDKKGLTSYLALALFTGIRPAQAKVMKPEQVDLEEARARADADQVKTRHALSIDMTPNAVAWFKLGGTFSPENLRRRMDAVRKAAKITWGHDIMRHSYASYFRALHGSRETADQLGHGTDEMATKHYVRDVKKKQAARFFSILPGLTLAAQAEQAAQEKTVPLAQAA